MSKVRHIQKQEVDNGDKIIQNYVNLFSKYSYNNQLYAKVSLHVILGQLLSKPTMSPNGKRIEKIPVYYSMGAREIDTRLHMLLIKPQGTGKGAGYGFVEDMAKALQIDFKPLTEATDAGLVGSLERDEDGDHVILEGLLKNTDIVGMEEASVLFDLNSDFSKKNMTYMQICMNALNDSSCFISKKLGPELIEFKPHSSFFLMTYPPDKLVDKLLKTGFMDRIICIFEDVTLSERLSIIRLMSNNINTVLKQENMQEFESVKNELSEVARKWTSNNAKPICMKIPNDVRNSILDVIDEFAMMILSASPKSRDKLEHFISRLFEVIVKLAIHHSVLCDRQTLHISDVMYARMLYMPIWRNLIINIESLLIISDVERHRTYAIRRQSLEEYDRIIKEEKFPHVRNKVWVRRLTMVQNLRMKWDQCSQETAGNNLKKLTKSSDDFATSNFKRYHDDAEKDKFFELRNFGDFQYLKKIKDM